MCGYYYELTDLELRGFIPFEPPPGFADHLWNLDRLFRDDRGRWPFADEPEQILGSLPEWARTAELPDAAFLAEYRARP